MPLSDLLDSLAGFGVLGSRATSTASNATSVSTGVSVNPTIANIFGGGSVAPSTDANVSPSSSAGQYYPPGSLGSVDLGSNIPGLNTSGQPQGPSLGNVFTASVGGIPVWLIVAGGLAGLLFIGGLAKRL